jgi:uncharacterized oxidoreductase
LKDEKTKVVEAMFPAVDTPWHKGRPPKIAISSEKAVNEMIKGLEKGKPEIRVGGAKYFIWFPDWLRHLRLEKVNQIE